MLPPVPGRSARRVNAPSRPASTASTRVATGAGQAAPGRRRHRHKRPGVLIGRRADGRPPRTFPGGKLEPGESTEQAAVCEVEEETGLPVHPIGIIGQRVQLQSGRLLVYVTAEPVAGTAVSVAAPHELPEAQWATLSEASELLAGMFGPIHNYLVRSIGPLCHPVPLAERPQGAPRSFRRDLWD